MVLLWGLVLLLFSIQSFSIVLPTSNSLNPSLDSKVANFTLEKEPIINLACGPVRGTLSSLNNTIAAYRGIPYGKAPVNKLRWQPPVAAYTTPLDCWDGTLDATKKGHSCYQAGDFSQSEKDQSEDCLNLDVWAPTSKKTTDAPLLPTMVWIYGGCNILGSIEWYKHIENIAVNGRVCFVAMNFRVNVFGYLALKELTQQDSRGVSGNYGIEDIRLALQWVQDNIKEFGCDPNRVTVLGQSSGATNIFALLSNPDNSKLLHRAIALSGSLNITASLKDLEKNGKVFVANTDCRNSDHVLDCLRALSPEKIISAMPPSWLDLSFWPTNPNGLLNTGLLSVDGFTIKASFTEAMQSRLVDIPLLLQTTVSELEVFDQAGKITFMTPMEYRIYLQKNFRPWGLNVGDQIADAYESTTSINVAKSYYDLCGDINNFCGLVDLAISAAQNGLSPVYISRFSHPPPHPICGLGSAIRKMTLPFHMWDIILATRSWDFFSSKFDCEVIKPEIADLNMGTQILNHWYEFAETGVIKSFRSIDDTPQFPMHYNTVIIGNEMRSGGITNVIDERVGYCKMLKSVGLRPDSRFWWIN